MRLSCGFIDAHKLAADLSDFVRLGWGSGNGRMLCLRGSPRLLGDAVLLADVNARQKSEYPEGSLEGWSHGCPILAHMSSDGGRLRPRPTGIAFGVP